MVSTTRRLVYALALIPIVPATATIGAVYLDSNVRPYGYWLLGLDDIRTFNRVCSNITGFC